MKLDGEKWEEIALAFCRENYCNIFSKLKKPLGETIERPRYRKFKDEVKQNYSGNLFLPIGQFLLNLKDQKDNFYRNFLNRYGDLTYCQFVIADRDYYDRAGVYAYFVGNDLKYIGRCKDSMKKRVNNGYGKIHPKNCYLDGQSTNCRLNYKITTVKEQVSLWFCPLESEQTIIKRERELIDKYNPPWNKLVVNLR